MLPVLSTNRLLLTPRSIEELEDCLAMDRDPLITRYIPGPWSDSKRHRSFVLDRMRRRYPSGLGYWSVRGLDGGEFLGWILLIPYEAFKGEIEIGWRFTLSNWGRGYATEAAAAVLEHAFKSAHVSAVVADINPLNHASIRVAEKIGMRYVGERAVDGELLKWYRLTSNEYQSAA